MAYTPQTWVDGSGGGTPLSAARLGYIETGITNAASVADSAFSLASGGGGGGTGGPMFPVKVASVDASSPIQAAADYVCDGTNDEVQINAALVDAAALNSRGGPVGGDQRGCVELSGGEFTISGSLLMYSGTWLRGQGALTRLKASSLTASTGSGTDPAIIKKATADEHLIRVSHLWLDGNGTSGGSTSHGIYFEGNGGTSRGGYPDSNPDTDHWIDNCWIHSFSGAGTTRHGILVQTSTGTAVERGGIISNCQIRFCSGDGVSIVAASDWRVIACHIGTMTRYGVRCSGGNTEVVNTKAYFCDTVGFYASSGRCMFTGCVSQDNEIGFFFDGAPTMASSLIADTSDAAGIQVSSAQCNVNGFQIFVRSGGRYTTQVKGLYFDATYADLSIVGSVQPANITTPVSGTVGSRSFMRVSDGTTLNSVG